MCMSAGNRRLGQLMQQASMANARCCRVTDRLGLHLQGGEWSEKKGHRAMSIKKNVQKRGSSCKGKLTLRRPREDGCLPVAQF